MTRRIIVTNERSHRLNKPTSQSRRDEDEPARGRVSRQLKEIPSSNDYLGLVMPALSGIRRRAESQTGDAIRRTFVDIGAISAGLTSREHQIIYGRRGTGKTHALKYLEASLRQRGHTVVVIDLRPIGSNGSQYLAGADGITTSSARTIIDLLGTIHDQLLTKSVELIESGFDVTALVHHLDAFVEASTDTEIVGNSESTQETSTSDKHDSRASLTLSPSPGVAFEFGGGSDQTVVSKRVQAGIQRFSLIFGSIFRALKGIVNCLPDRSLHLILDEWNALPVELQPIVADFLRRCVLPVDGTVVKIAAIQARSRFIYRLGKGYVGFELGADIAADLDLDEYTAWNGVDTRAEDFFRSLFCRHINEHWRYVAGNRAPVVSLGNLDKAIPDLQYLVMAAGGVPRDAINVAYIAAQQSRYRPIELQHIAAATRKWFLKDKEGAVDDDYRLRRVLENLRTYADDHRRRGFLLDRRHDAREHEIQDLYDSRIIHRTAIGIGPGGHYDAFILDFGAYADRPSSHATARAWRENWMSSWNDFVGAHSEEVRKAILTVESLRAAH